MACVVLDNEQSDAFQKAGTQARTRRSACRAKIPVPFSAGIESVDSCRVPFYRTIMTTQSDQEARGESVIGAVRRDLSRRNCVQQVDH